MENSVNNTEVMNVVENNNNVETFNVKKRGDIYNIDPKAIVVTKGFNARRDFDLEDLKSQILAEGVLNPITVIPFNDENGVERYRLVDGERRYRALMELINEGHDDFVRVKAMFLPKNTKEETCYIQQMMRNEGKRFTAYEEAIFFQTFKEKFGYTQNEIAEKFGKKASYISKCLSFLDLPAEIQEKMANGEISTDAVAAIVKSNKGDEKAQIEQVEKAVDEAKKQGKKTATTKTLAPNLQVANIIAKMRKDMKKAVGLLEGYECDSAKGLMNYLNELYNQTSGFEYIAKNEVVDNAPAEETETTETETVEATEAPVTEEVVETAEVEATTEIEEPTDAELAQSELEAELLMETPVDMENLAVMQ